MKTIRISAMLAILTLMTVPAAATNGWWDDLYEDKAVTLEQVIAHPEAYKGMDISFVVQFHQLGQIDNPYYTRFEKGQYLNFSVWSDTAPLWDKKAYSADFPYLFIDRIATECQTILTSSAYDRFLITGRVASVFRGKPWIEVVGLKALEKNLTEPTLIKMVKAYKLKKAKRYDAAATEFNQATNEKLPTNVQTILNREAGVCFAAANRYKDALVPLERAVSLVPGDKNLIKVLAHCRAQLQKSPVKTASKDKKSKTKDKPKLISTTKKTSK
ncbi:MAG: hypothetical protein ACI97A_002206 [Planctomycetota bacterium]|jgi:hypothetical protein